MLEENKFSYRALLHGKDAEWYFARGLDDITAAGSYEVRLFHNDMEALGITTADCDKEHYVVAHLFVSESAATGKQQALRLVGQTLLLTICATNAVKAFTRTCETTPKGASWGSWVDLGAASTTDIQDGSITAQKLSRDIRPSVQSPLRPLFVTAGAEYNDTGVDKTKTAPWGETVTHKAGHYYLNGLGDITEEQMMRIYNTSNNYILSDNISCIYFQSNIRTNICKKGTGWSKKNITSASLSFYSSKFEIIMLANPAWPVEDTYCFQAGNISSMFDLCTCLKRIIGIINITTYADGLNTAFTRCPALVSVKIKGLNNNTVIKDSPLIDKDSLLYMIENSNPSTAITIILHPDAYVRFADDADVVAALEVQPLVSLVSA